LMRYGNSFAKTMMLAAGDLLEEGVSTREWAHIGRLIGDLGNRMRWLFAGALHLTNAEPTEEFRNRVKEAYNGALNVSHAKADILEHARLKTLAHTLAVGCDDPSLALSRGVRALRNRQRTDGAREGEPGFSPLTAAWYVLANYAAGRPIPQH